MYKRYDQFTLNLLRDALTRATDAETEVPVPSAPPQSIDVFCVPNPARAAELARLGLLGELVDGPTMFEPFHGTPSLERVQNCLRKQLNWQHVLELRADADRRENGRGGGGTGGRRWGGGARSRDPAGGAPPGAGRDQPGPAGDGPARI